MPELPPITTTVCLASSGWVVMRVATGYLTGRSLRQHQEIVLLKIGAGDSRRLRLCRVQRQSASDHQHRYHHDSSSLHVNLLLAINMPAEVI